MGAEMLSRIRAVETSDRTSRSLYEDELARREGERRRAQAWILTSPFYLAVELAKKGESHSRLFLMSRGETQSAFRDHGIVAPLAPIGRIALQVKNQIKDGRSPSEFRVDVPRWRGGPINTTVWISRGVVADVTFVASAAHAIPSEVVLWDAEEKGQPVVLTETGVQIESAVRGPRQGFGLGDVIAAIDLDQLRSIDFPEDGPLVVTGSAGTGKTTVAMYRAAFLLSEQADALIDDADSPVYFRADRFIVLVRKDHLRPYLERLAVEMRMPQGLRVDTFDRWFQEKIFRPYLRIDQKRVTYSEDSKEDWERWTASLNERDIRAYVEHDVSALARPLFERLANLSLEFVQALESQDSSTLSASRRETMAVLRQGWFATARRLSDGLPWRPAALIGRLEVATQLHRDIGKNLRDSDLQDWDTALRPLLDRHLAELSRARDQARGNLYRPDRLLRGFYGSQACKVALLRELSPAAAEQAIRELSDASRPFHRADQVVALWLLSELVEGVDEEAPAHLRPLPTYDHVIVDEAQYYPPALLRFVARLARRPRSAVTIVGDLDQRFGSNIGPTAWSEILSDEHQGRVQRLERLYRCSREIYEFLFDLQPLLGLARTLNPPREVDRFSGAPPQIAVAQRVADEIQWLGDEIEYTRNQDERASIVVILGDGSDSLSWRTKLVATLTERGVPARWATGEDMKENAEKVMVTSSDFVVGLEFDHVFIPGIDHLWVDRLDAQTSREFWVAATRAKRSLRLSGTRIPEWLGSAPIGGVTPRLTTPA